MKAKIQRIKRQKRIRKKITGTSQIPRLSVFRSNKYIYAQLIDDVQKKTIVAATDLKFKDKKNKHSFSTNKQSFSTNKHSFSTNKLERAKDVGETIAKLAKDKKIKKVVFDRDGYKYHGRVKALAQGAREGGLLF